MFDLKAINLVLDQMEKERNIPREKIIEAIGASLAMAYKKEYGRKSQNIKADFDINTGKADFYQVKIVVDDTNILTDEEVEEIKNARDQDLEIDENLENKIRFNDDAHIKLSDALRIKKDVVEGDELIFSLEHKDDFGRIAAQTAKQIIMQKIREAEKSNLVNEFGDKEGEIVNGTVDRIDRGMIFVNLGKLTGAIPFDEQIPGESFSQGEKIKAYLVEVDDAGRGVFLRLSRRHPGFLAKLFEIEVPELKSNIVSIKAIAREAGSRSKIAVISNDANIDPVGSLVGQGGSRVGAVMKELRGEKIDIIEYSEDIAVFIERALSPAEVLGVDVEENDKVAHAVVSDDQQSLAIGKKGQNVRLAAKLTSYRIDIKSVPQDQDVQGDQGENDEYSL